MTLSKWNLENKMSNLLRLVACLFVLLSFNTFAVDTDGDGFSDADEATLGTDPNDPTSPLENKLTASDGAPGDYFGYSVAIDGDTAVIGAKTDHYGSGSAYVYVRSNGVWSEQGKLTASDGAYGDDFGSSVSIDGDTVVISAHSDDDNGTNSGLAYVYVRSNGVWSEQQKLTASDGAADDHFGISVSIDGDTAVIGAYGDDDNGTNSGSAYVYVRSNGVWSEQQKLTASDGAEIDLFGGSVSIDGDTAVIGARLDDDNGNDSGSAYVYVRSNGVWSEQQKITASDGSENDRFGYSVSIDGDTAVIGAQGDGSYSGSAYVYVRSNGVWTEQQKLTASDNAEADYFGASVSISGDTAVIGAYADDDNGNGSGSAYVFPLTPPYQDTPAVISGDTSATINQGGNAFGVLSATDSNGLTDGSYFTVSTPPVQGQAIITASSGSWVYLGNALYAGQDPFTVTVTDDQGYATEQIISITIVGADTDSDTIYDPSDNCPNIPNTDQANLDGDSLGDVCDDDIDGDGTDNAFDAFPNDLSETTDTDADTVGDNSDNCVNDANTNQSDIDGDIKGDVCDSDMDGDGYANVFEIRFGGDETDNTDAAVSLANAVTFSETAPADSDLDGVPDDVEAMLGEDNTSSTFQDLLDTLSTIATVKNVPAMGGIGLLALGLSMLGLGAVRMRRK
ncbi:thrombospondin type 3 repeat-containing protein [Pseudomonadales bacterium]|nr:thrombospondin type 3 repeat-containing protein [Pseudomonadales bacterium]